MAAEFIDTPELLDTVHELYEGKWKLDLRCRRNAETRKSMAQFLFLFFRERAGGPDAGVARSYNFINSLFINAGHVEAALFLAILRNEVDEEFAGVFFKFRSDVEALLRAAGEALVRRESALALLEKLYLPDYPFLGELRAKLEAAVRAEDKRRALQQSMQARRPRPRPAKGEEEEPPRFLRSGDLLEALLANELRNRRIFLSGLAAEFRSADPENFGFVARKKFVSLARGILRRLGKKGDPRKALMKRQGFDPSVLSFSDAVHLSSKIKVRGEGEGAALSLLEALNASLAAPAGGGA